MSVKALPLRVIMAFHRSRCAGIPFQSIRSFEFALFPWLPMPCPFSPKRWRFPRAAPVQMLGLFTAWRLFAPAAGFGLNHPPDTATTPKLWYRQPAEAWNQALPVGNGRLGAMVFGGIAAEHIQLNEETLWTGGPYDPVVKGAATALPEIRRFNAEHGDIVWRLVVPLAMKE